MCGSVHFWGKHCRAGCELLNTCAGRMATDKNVGVVKMVLSWLWLQSCSLGCDGALPSRPLSVGFALELLTPSGCQRKCLCYFMTYCCHSQPHSWCSGHGARKEQGWVCPWTHFWFGFFSSNRKRYSCCWFGNQILRQLLFGRPTKEVNLPEK